MCSKRVLYRAGQPHPVFPFSLTGGDKVKRKPGPSRDLAVKTLGLRQLSRLAQAVQMPRWGRLYQAREPPWSGVQVEPLSCLAALPRVDLKLCVPAFRQVCLFVANFLVPQKGKRGSSRIVTKQPHAHPGGPQRLVPSRRPEDKRRSSRCYCPCRKCASPAITFQLSLACAARVEKPYQTPARFTQTRSTFGQAFTAALIAIPAGPPQ